MGGAGFCHEQRQWPHPLVGVGLGELAVFKHRHRPPTQIVIKPGNRPVDQLGIGPIPGAARGEHGLGCRHDEKGPFEPAGRLMFEQIAVELPIGRQQLVEDQAKNGGRLPIVAEGGVGLL